MPQAKLTGGRLFLLISMFVYVTCTGAILSLQAPFYPLEARNKGATPAEVYATSKSFIGEYF